MNPEGENGLNDPASIVLLLGEVTEKLKLMASLRKGKNNAK